MSTGTATATATQAQIDANRANAQLSTGPKTEAGKLAASANATTTGLTGTRIFVPPGQEEKFQQFKDNLETEVLPISPLELQLFDTLLHAAWNVLRCMELEEILQNEAVALGLPDVMFDDHLSRKLDRIYRYKKMHEATQRRVIAELRILQTELVWRRESQEFHQDSDLAATPRILGELRKMVRRNDKDLKQQRHQAIQALIDPPDLTNFPRREHNPLN